MINTAASLSGDINKDNKANIFDLVSLHNMANGNGMPSKVADLDKDNKISAIFDSAILRRIILGIK
jgi:hypothetical protein